MIDCDVLVIGGGPAGATVAARLAAADKRVVVVERGHYEQSRVGETLPPRARVPLERLDVLDRMESDGHLPSPALVSVWGNDAPQHNDFITSPYGHGWHIDRARFDRMLADECRARGASVLEGTKAGFCTHGPEGWRVSLHTGSRQSQEHVECRFLVDASGSGARRIPHSGAPLQFDRLVGVSAVYVDRPGADADNSTLIEAIRHGWWYSARLPDERAIAVFMTDSDLVHGGRGGLRSFLQHQLDEAPHTRQRVCPIAEARSVTASPAITCTHTVVSGPDWLLAGDAAMSWDPLSGQGLCKALESGIDAAVTIGRALDGDAEATKDYGRRVSREFDEYLKSRSDHYAAEQRWRDFPFWSRRHAAIRG